MNSDYGLNGTVSDEHFPAVSKGVNLAEGPYGKPGGSYSFSGTTNSYIEIPKHNKLNTRFAITVMMWVRPQSDGPLFQYHHSTQWYVSLWFKKIGSYLKFLWVIKSQKLTASSTLTYDAKFDKWQHLAVSYSSSNAIMEIWTDGHKQIRKQFRKLTIKTTDGPIRIGKVETSGNTRYFKGQISCLQVYEMALTGNEILETMDRCFLPSGKKIICHFVINWMLLWCFARNSLVNF